jgi:hypothetical protein
LEEIVEQPLARSKTWWYLILCERDFDHQSIDVAQARQRNKTNNETKH